MNNFELRQFNQRIKTHSTQERKWGENRMSTEENAIQNCPREEICNEFYKSSQAHPVLQDVFLESLVPRDDKTWNQHDPHKSDTAAMYW